jgi:hypothetical protein
LATHITYISSTSGGTLTAALYALYRNESNPDFNKFYNKALSVLQGETLLETALEILNQPSDWKGPKSRNLINAFAKAYDKLAFNHAEFSAFDQQKLTVCFNATEFYRGLSFRFQNHGYLGNKFINLLKEKKEITGKIKMADIMAASSCFPLGFEPIEFPKDFTHDGLTESELKSIIRVTNYEGEEVKDAVIPLMDGGITDNQGLNSAMLADMNGRVDNKPPIDLFLVTDVASYFMDHYKVPEIPKGPFWKLKLNALNRFILTGAYLALIASVYFLLFGSGKQTLIGGLLFFPSLVIAGWHAFVVARKLVRLIFYNRKVSFADVRNLFNLNKSFSDSIFIKLEKFFKKSRVGFLALMMKNRLSSVSTMVNDVNLKQVRRLINDLFYSNDLFGHRRCANYIYDYSVLNLARKEKRITSSNWPEEDKKRMMPSEAMTRVAESARTMGTTLWFEKNDRERLGEIIACGRFTTCGSLLEYILDLENNPNVWNTFTPETKQNVASLKAQLTAHWEKFKLTPITP